VFAPLSSWENRALRFDILEKVHKNGNLMANRKETFISARNDYLLTVRSPKIILFGFEHLS